MEHLKERVKGREKENGLGSLSSNSSIRIVKILTIFPPRILIDKNPSIDLNYSGTLREKRNHLVKRILLKKKIIKSRFMEQSSAHINMVYSCFFLQESIYTSVYMHMSQMEFIHFFFIWPILVSEFVSFSVCFS